MLFLAAMEKYSKPDDMDLTATRSHEEVTGKQSERKADLAKEEKTSGRHEKITHNKEVCPAKSNRGKNISESDKPDKNPTQSCQKQQKGENTAFYAAKSILGTLPRRNDCTKN